jgi:hypothetical protein
MEAEQKEGDNTSSTKRDKDKSAKKRKTALKQISKALTLNSTKKSHNQLSLSQTLDLS